MNLHHRNKAVLGVSVWFAVFIAFMILFLANWPRTFDTGMLRGDAPVGLIWSTVLAQYLLFFWGGYHLARAKGYTVGVLAPGVFPCFQILTIVVLLVMPDKNANSSGHSRSKQSHHSHESKIARVVRFRRNALLGNAFGLAGIFIGASLVLVPLGFGNPDNQTSAGIGVFICGYAGVISGCWWWAKAKDWPDAIVCIGLLPLGILFVPWVRLIFVVAPLLLPTSMVMMPLILLVIMFVLPDKSGIQKRRHWERD
jgi:hypothetical protein